METVSGVVDTSNGGGSSSSNLTRYGLRIPALSLLQSPLSNLLEYSGILRLSSDDREEESGIIGRAAPLRRHLSRNGEVAIRIEQEESGLGESEESLGQIADVAGGEPERVSPASTPSGSDRGVGGEEEIGGGGGHRDTTSSSSSQRYDMQLVARWVEQILPFSLLLLIVFIRQHLQGKKF